MGVVALSPVARLVQVGVVLWLEAGLVAWGLQVGAVVRLCRLGPRALGSRLQLKALGATLAPVGICRAQGDVSGFSRRGDAQV